MSRRLASALLPLLVAILVPVSSALALPPDPELDQWNEGDVPVQEVGETEDAYRMRVEAWIKKIIERMTWNCYNYAADVKSTDGNGDAVRAQPGRGMRWPGVGDFIAADSMCRKVKARAIADGLRDIAWSPGDSIPTPPAGENLVALGGLAGIKGGGADYHWWRLNGDGSWSHKRGGTEAKTTYTDMMGNEQTLTNPRDAGQRDGYDLCGFMTVPKAATPALGSLAAAPVCTPRPGNVLVQPVDPSGFPEPQRALDDAEESQMIPLLPSFAPSNQVPNPNWVTTPAGGYQGFLVITQVGGLGPIPPYMRVFGGVVEVVRAWPDAPAGKVYYADNHGLEPFLFDRVVFQQSGPCVIEQGTMVLTPCRCTDMALGTTPSTDVGENTPDRIWFSVGPNPGLSQTVRFGLPQSEQVEIGVYDLTGRRVALLVRGELPAGTHRYSWNGADADGRTVGPGIYFFRLRAGRDVRLNQVVRIR